MIDSVIKNYFLCDQNYIVKPFGNGHINDTYKVELNPSSVYILQRINTAVFRNPQILIDNHLKIQKINDGSNSVMEIAKLIQDSYGNYLFTDRQGGAWRLTSYFTDSYSIDVVEESWQAYQSGLGFGWFAKTTHSLDVKDFKEAIPDFHSLSFRLGQLEKAINDDKAERAQSNLPLIQFYKQREQSLRQVERLIQCGEIPLRVVHNDTKINNILFRDKKAIAVIDLDTVGPGSILFDYGDALRTGANSAVEDEKKLEKVSFNIELFRAFTVGYLSQVKEILTPKEEEFLYLAPVLMTYIMGIRFLADYLKGDVYYKIAYPDHNLDRSKVQMKLIESIESKENIMQEIIIENLR